ncbi:hypothetical protein [Mesorhizobium sp. M8A.F.Ca.ET.021.01.1.1]|uniref:hypothetical protein n=1 Tax=Mesorhizobium sp. M8A.F.Ca.ET.021.01.1.1 TaxID=2496757 RepID=UPI0032AEC4BF
MAELDVLSLWHHLGEDLAPVFQRHISKIMAVDVRQIEGEEIQVMLTPGEVRKPASFSTMISPSMMALSTSRSPAALAGSRYLAVQSSPRRVKTRTPVSSLMIWLR